MRRKRTQAEGSLDSLLDTMTNVVGILVILLVVTQLGVREAVDRISEGEQVDPAELAAAEAKAAAARERRESLAVELASLTQRPTASSAEDLAKLQEKIRQQTATLNDIREVLDDELAKRSAEVAAQNAVTRDKQKELEDQIAALEMKYKDQAELIAKLKAQLAATPRTAPLAAKVVHLPDPRPAPEGALPLTFYCRGGKVYFVNIALHQNRAVKWTDAEVARRRLDRDPKAGIDCGPLFASFNRQNFRDRDVEIQLETRGRVPYLIFKRRDTGGETLDEIADRQSYFRRGVDEVDPSKFYFQFLVWNDSFELYLEARRIAEARGLLAGWQAMTSADEYSARLESKLRCGPPPPPPPPNPNPPPKPAPGPQPPPREVPLDVID
ncbi:MAG: hypothetical protein KDA41_07995 [Planctomycetales bacterium]|nr:hypothetical protein [Planctomycetales bacterium]